MSGREKEEQAQKVKKSFAAMHSIGRNQGTKLFPKSRARKGAMVDNALPRERLLRAKRRGKKKARSRQGTGSRFAAWEIPARRVDNSQEDETAQGSKAKETWCAGGGWGFCLSSEKG